MSIMWTRVAAEHASADVQVLIAKRTAQPDISMIAMDVNSVIARTLIALKHFASTNAGMAMRLMLMGVNLAPASVNLTNATWSVGLDLILIRSAVQSANAGNQPANHLSARLNVRMDMSTTLINIGA